MARGEAMNEARIKELRQSCNRTQIGLSDSACRELLDEVERLRAALKWIEDTADDMIGGYRDSSHEVKLRDIARAALEAK
jgi:hypothetical protein